MAGWKHPPYADLKKLAEKMNKPIKGAIAKEYQKEIDKNLNNKFLGFGHGILTRKSGVEIRRHGIRLGTSQWYGANWERGRWKPGFKRMVAYYTGEESRVRRKKGESDAKYNKRRNRQEFFREVNKAQARYRGKAKRPFISNVLKRTSVIVRKALRRKANG